VRALRGVPASTETERVPGMTILLFLGEILHVTNVFKI
jgi:hypothetical protein